MRGVDLSQFQFDFDLTWAGFFLRADGTVYARYGSRDDSGPMSRNSLAGLTLTMERVLEAHKAYPQNKDAYRDKRGPKPRHDRPESIPVPMMRRITSKETSSNNCIHCHNVYDAQHQLAAQEGNYDPDKFWKYPLPEQIGLRLDKTTGNRVVNVMPNSAAEVAQFKEGDVIETVDGQAIHSLADLQFVLHFYSSSKPLGVVVRRGDDQQQHTLELPLHEERFAGWRRASITWRGSLYGMPPKPQLWIELLAKNKRKQLSIDEHKMALEVRGIFGPAVRKSKLKRGDVIVALDGDDEYVTAAKFHERLRLNYYQPGSRMRLKILRDGREQMVSVEL